MVFENSISNGWKSYFWSPSFWLPKNTTWDDFNDTTDVTYPKYYEAFYPILLSVLIFLLRYIIERFIFIPFGTRNGLKSNKKPVIPIPLIEEELKKNPKGLLKDQKQILGLAKQLDWSERQVERWIRRRKQQNRHSELNKFAEYGWKLCYHSFTILFGIFYLWNKTWLWNLSECWTNYPHQNVSVGIKVFFLLQLSYYWSLLVFQFFDARRKDFWGMFIHHVATIYLLTVSYISNGIRIGMMIQVLHDSADVFFETANCLKYLKNKLGWLRDLSFALFVPIWVVTRLVIFPGYIVKHLFFDADVYVNVPPSIQIGIWGLVILFLLHIMWTYYLIIGLYGILVYGKRKDVRSSSSEQSEASSISENNNHT